MCPSTILHQQPIIGSNSLLTQTNDSVSLYSSSSCSNLFPSHRLCPGEAPGCRLSVSESCSLSPWDAGRRDGRRRGFALQAVQAAMQAAELYWREECKGWFPSRPLSTHSAASNWDKPPLSRFLQQYYSSLLPGPAYCVLLIDLVCCVEGQSMSSMTLIPPGLTFKKATFFP